MYYKEHSSERGLMLAVADVDIIGKKFKFKDVDFFVNPKFYGSAKADKVEIIRLLKESFSANLVGKKAVACGVEAGLVDKNNIIKITKDVPHAQIIVMNF